MSNIKYNIGDIVRLDYKDSVSSDLAHDSLIDSTVVGFSCNYIQIFVPNSANLYAGWRKNRAGQCYTWSATARELILIRRRCIKYTQLEFKF